MKAPGQGGPGGAGEEEPGRRWCGPWGEAGAEPLLGNYFCDSYSPCPSLCPGHWPRPEGQAPQLCFSGAPPSQKGGWAQIWGGAAESQDWEQPSPRRKLWSWPAVASTPSTPIPDRPAPAHPHSSSWSPTGQVRGGGRTRGGAAAPRALLHPLTHRPERGAGSSTTGLQKQQQ